MPVATAAPMMVIGLVRKTRAEAYPASEGAPMSLRTPTSPLPPALKPSARSRIPIARIPQPPQNKMASTWRLAKPGRIAAALRTAQSRNPGGWFVAGASGDVGVKESVTRTVAGREVVF